MVISRLGVSSFFDKKTNDVVMAFVSSQVNC